MVEDADARPDSILEEIVLSNEDEMAQQKEKVPLQLVKRSIAAASAARSFTYELHQSTLSPALITEVKKASPSKGVI